MIESKVEIENMVCHARSVCSTVVGIRSTLFISSCFFFASLWQNRKSIIISAYRRCFFFLFCCVPPHTHAHTQTDKRTHRRFHCRLFCFIVLCLLSVLLCWIAVCLTMCSDGARLCEWKSFALHFLAIQTMILYHYVHDFCCIFQTNDRISVKCIHKRIKLARLYASRRNIQMAWPSYRHTR